MRPELDRPSIVCLCGSTRFIDEFRKANLKFTLAGVIVLSIGCDTKSDTDLKITSEVKRRLDELHLRKIDMSDGIYVLNVDGYIGGSTDREIRYAIKHGKPVNWLEPTRAPLEYIEVRPHRTGIGPWNT